MASVGGFFKGLGHVFKVVFTNPVALKLEATAVGIAFPGFGILANSAADSIISAENTATAAGVQNGTGAQKFAYALSQFGPVYDVWAKQNNVEITDAHKQAFLQNIFNILQLSPQIVAVVEASHPTVPVANPIPVTEPPINQTPVSSITPNVG